MDVNSLIKAFSTLDLGFSRTTDHEVTTSTQDAQVNTNLIVRIPTLSSNAATATPSLNINSLPPQASLLGLPRELKDQIYGYLTESEGRIILAWRFVENYKRHYPALSYEDCFNSAIALNPLSMTCKQMLNEFQPALLRATKTRWTLLVNNFNLEQLQLFGNRPPVPNAKYNFEFTLRFQMDNNAVYSADRLRDLILSGDPDDPNSIGALHWVTKARIEVATLLSPRTSRSAKHVRSMTKGQAKRIEFSLRDLHYMLMPALDWGYPGETDYDRAHELWFMEFYWFEPFYKAVKDMGVVGKVEGNRV